MAQPNFPRDRQCLPLDLPPALNNEIFVGGEGWEVQPGVNIPIPPSVSEFMNWSSSAVPLLSESITDLGRDMYQWTIDAADSLVGLLPPIDISMEDIDTSDYRDLSVDAPINAGNTNINIGANNAKQNNLLQAMFGNGVGVVLGGFRRAPVVPATAKTDISGYDCDTGRPGSGAINFMYHVSDNELNPDVVQAFENMQLATSNAQNTDDWSNVQNAVNEWVDAVGSHVQEDDGQEKKMSWVVLNISTSTIPEGSSLLISPDQFGNFWAVVAGCEGCG